MTRLDDTLEWLWVPAGSSAKLYTDQFERLCTVYLRHHAVSHFNVQPDGVPIGVLRCLDCECVEYIREHGKDRRLCEESAGAYPENDPVSIH